MSLIRTTRLSRIPVSGPLPPPAPHRPDPAPRIAPSLLRGFLGRCPRCGKGPCRRGYLAIRSACPQCGEPLGHIRADDGPAYFTLLIAGHAVVPVSLWVERSWSPPLSVHLPIAVAAMLLLIWRLLPAVKGAMVGLMWALGLRGDERQGD